MKRSSIPPQKNDLNWMNYASLGTQLIAGLLLLLFIGKKGDEYFVLNRKLIWILPCTFILLILFKIIKDTQPKK